VLFVGRLLPHKGVDTLIRALPTDLSAQIVGPVADARYERDLRELAAGKRVTFRHDCDDAALVEAYRASSCIVLPSVYRDMYGDETKVPELLGQTLLEGMATGLPAVCTSVASLPEIVRNGQTGLVVPPSDPVSLGEAIRWLRDHPARARAMGEAARASMLARFSWPTVVQRCLDVYGLDSSALTTSSVSREGCGWEQAGATDPLRRRGNPHLSRLVGTGLFPSASSSGAN
jgi:glycosyltransferase involved in cell wall biosynthesis